jgi:hypothetical protein
MKCLPFIATYRTILLVLLAAACGDDLLAQVPTTLQFPRSAQTTAHLIHVRWQQVDEEAWKAKYDDNMDRMGLKTQLSSTALLGLSNTDFRFFLQEGSVSSIECLIAVESIVPDESIQLIDIHSDKVICDFKIQPGKRFMTPAFDPAVTALVWKLDHQGERQSRFTIETIYYASGSLRNMQIGFGSSLACHPNTACKTDSMSLLISNSAMRVRVVTQEGAGYCTGAMVNNARNDKTPYVLTAFHCQWNATPLYDQWKFEFEYVSPTCPNPPTEPQLLSLTGCELVSSGQGSDYLLLKLNEDIPDNWDVTFAGWNRDDVNTADSSYHVHHPQADIRKFSTSTEKAIVHTNAINWSEGYTTPANHHIRFEFTEGGHEPGSSGGPIFDQDGFLIGQLHGGSGGCAAQSNTFVGRFSKSWNLGSTPATRLRDWLDPDNSGVMTIPHLPNVLSGDLVNIEGLVLDPKGNPCVHAEIVISGSSIDTFTTDAQGRFTLSAVDRNGTYTITPAKNTLPQNGLNVLDVLAIQKHSLAKDTFDFAWQHIAADATNNGAVSVGDMLQITRLLLGKITAFIASPSWRFDPPAITLQALPPGETARINFTAIKIGDVNGTADPTQ